MLDGCRARLILSTDDEESPMIFSKVFALVPARGGSVTVPRKNIVLLAGKPLIAYTIETALNSGVFDRVIVSTDDDTIAEEPT